MSNLEQLREGWDRYAEAYDDGITPYSMRVAEDVLRLAGVERGTRLLDVAAGPGALSIPAARVGADVLAIDYSPVMVELLQARAEHYGLSNLTVRVMDGTALQLEDNTFDFGCSQLGIMLFPDRAQGLRELVRVTKPGGKGVMVVFAAPERVQFFSLFFQALNSVDRGISSDTSPLFSLQDPDVLSREMEDAGFREVHVETRSHYFDIESPDQLWATIETSAPAIAGILARLSEDQRRAAKARLTELVRAEYGDSSSKLPADMNVGIGVK